MCESVVYGNPYLKIEKKYANFRPGKISALNEKFFYNFS